MCRTHGLKKQHTMKKTVLKRGARQPEYYLYKSKRCEKSRLKATHPTKTKLGAENTIKLA